MGWIKNLITLFSGDNDKGTGNFHTAEIKDRVWKNKAEKQKGLVFLLKDNPDALLVYWFEDTRTEFENWISSFGVRKIPLQQASSLDPSKTGGKTIIVLERYPLRKKEAGIFSLWQPHTIFILSSLEDILLVKFGSQNIVSIMEKMGMKNDEFIEHSMITQAIERAQQKLEEKITVEKTANSQEEWFRKNIVVVS